MAMTVRQRDKFLYGSIPAGIGLGYSLHRQSAAHATEFRFFEIFPGAPPLEAPASGWALQVISLEPSVRRH
jgi:hypothetical protein